MWPLDGGIRVTRTLLERQIHRLHSRLMKSGSLEVGPRNLHLTNYPGDSGNGSGRASLPEAVWKESLADVRAVTTFAPSLLRGL